ncbi:MAG: DUF2914 domain-containing protein [Pseudomonadota bacterium]
MKTIRSTFLASLAGVFLLNTALVCAEGAKLVLGTKVEKHIVQNERDHFAFHDGQVWAQIELKPSTDGHVTFVWTRDGHPYSEFKTPTKHSDRYRTHAFVTARPGKWHVAVKSEADIILAEKDFVIDGDIDHPHDAIHTHTVQKADTVKAATKETEKPVSGITEALKAINPTDTKSEEKANPKPSAEVKKAHPAKVETKPATVQTKAVESNIDIASGKVDAKVSDIKPATPKA